MQLSQGSTLQVARLATVAGQPVNLVASERRTLLARPHPLLSGHAGLVDSHGIYRVVKLGEGGSRASVDATYELQLCTDGGFAQPLVKEWRAFEHLADDGLVLCHRGSGRILFAQLPLCEGEHSAVFLFGSHDGPVLSLAANRGLLLSGGADGSVRLWSLDSGALVDCCRRAADGHAVGQVTAVAFVGPLMVSTGTDQGTVCLYDISTSRLEAVQRFHAGEGPVAALACRITPRQAHDAVTASAPRGLDGGGVLAGPVGLPWRSAAAGADERGGTETLLAVASLAGWLHVYRAARSGEDAWQLVHVGALAGEPFLSASPDGNYLAVGSGSRLEVLDANTLQVMHEQHFSPLGGPLAGAGFLPGSAGGSTLVALPAGGTLAGGIRLRLYAAPAGDDPSMLQLTVPLLEPGGQGQPYAEAARDEHFLSWLQRTATATDPAGGGGTAAVTTGPASPAAAARLLSGLTLGSPAAGLGGAARLATASSPAATHNPAWGWQALAPSESTSSSPRAGVQGGGTQTRGDRGAHASGTQPDRSPSAEPWASPPPWASGFGTGAAPGSAEGSARRPGGGAGGAKTSSPLGSPGRGKGAAGASPAGHRFGSGGGEPGGATRGSEARLGGGEGGGKAAAAHTWQAYRPATQPAPRSWITGLPPRSDFLPQPVPPPPQQQEQQHAARAQRGSPGRAAHSTQAPASPAPSRVGIAAGRNRPARGAGEHNFAADPLVTAEEEAVGGVFRDGGEGGLEGIPEAESELPCSGTLLPASGIPPAASASTGRYGALFDDGEDEGSAAAVAVAEARWRAGDLDMPPDSFRPSTFPAVALSSDDGPAHGGVLGMSFRFQLPQQHHQQQQFQQQTQQQQTFKLPWEGSEAGAGSAAVGGALYGNSVQDDGAAGDWAGEDPNPLGRTAYFGDALAAALQGGPDGTSRRRDAGTGSSRQSTPRSGGDRQREAEERYQQPTDRTGQGEGDEEEEVPRRGFAVQQPQPSRKHAAAHSPAPALPVSAAGAAVGRAGGLVQGDRAEHQARDQRGEEEDDPVPRGAAGLPAPQPEWSQQRLAHQRLPGPGSDGQPEEAAAEEEEQEELASQLPHVVVRRSVVALNGYRASHPATDEAAAADSGPPGAEAAPDGAWSGWANADVLSAPAERPRPGSASAQGGIPAPRRALRPRQPPPSSGDRLKLSSPLGQAATGAAKASGFNAGVPDVSPSQPRQVRPGYRTDAAQGTLAAAGAAPADADADAGSGGFLSASGLGGSGPPASAGQRPALSAFRGFKPNHAKIMQQLRRKPAPLPAARPAAVTEDAAQALSHGAQLHPRYGADDGGDEATPASSVLSAAGPPSLLQSPSVLLGSPNASVMTGASGPGAAAGGAKRNATQQQQPQRGANTSSSLGSVTSGGRLHLQHLRQLRHHQHQSQLLQRCGKSAHGSQTAAAATAAAEGPALEAAAAAAARSPYSRSVAASAPNIDVREDRDTGGASRTCRRAATAAAPPPPSASTSTSPWATPAGRVGGGHYDGIDDGNDEEAELEGYLAARVAGPDAAPEEEGAGEIEGPGLVDNSGDASLQVPVFGSSALLLRKMDALKQVIARPAAAAVGARPGPRARGRGGGGAALPGEGAAEAGPAAGLNEAAWEEAARRAATSAANVPPSAQLYRDLAPLEDTVQPTRLAKQLHPGWVASRLAKPELGTLWKPTDHTREVCNTRGVALYVPPSPAEVAASALGLQWLC